MIPEHNVSYTAIDIIRIIKDNFKDTDNIILITTHSGLRDTDYYKRYDDGFAVDTALGIIARLKDDVCCTDKWFIHLGKNIVQGK